jgi:O-antigen ligase
MGPPGFFENSGELAIQMLVFTPIAYHFAVGLRPWLTKVKYWLLMAFPLTGAMTVLGASSRGGQVGLAAEVLFTFFTGKRLIKAIAVTAVLAAAGWAVLPDEQKTRFLEAGDDTTSQQRLLYWSHGIDMIQSHPLLGIGYFNFPLYFERHYPESLIVSEAQLPHNIFIQIGVDLGILGLIVYLILIYRAFRSTMDVRSAARNAPQLAFYVTLSKGFDTAFIGFLVAGQFVSVVYYPFMWIHLALVVALRNIVQKATAPAEEKRGVGVVLSPRGVDRESIKVLR